MELVEHSNDEDFNEMLVEEEIVNRKREKFDIEDVRLGAVVSYCDLIISSKKHKQYIEEMGGDELLEGIEARIENNRRELIQTVMDLYNVEIKFV